MAKNKVEITGIDTSTLKTLNTEEMNNLFIELQKGNRSAKNALIEGNLKLVLSILKKYQNRCDNLDDLFQIGTIGLIKAIDNFDLSFGVKFSTYAVLMIEGEIKRYIRDNNQIRISRTIKELSYQIINYKETYVHQWFYQTYYTPGSQDYIKEYAMKDYSTNEIYSITTLSYSTNECENVVDAIIRNFKKKN